MHSACNMAADVEVLSNELSETIKQEFLIAHEEKKKKSAHGHVLAGFGLKRPLVRDVLKDGRFISLIHMCDGTTPNEPDPVSDPLLTYNAKMYSSGVFKWEKLKFWKEPKTVLDVKRLVEKKLQIPTICQELSYRNRDYGNNAKIETLGLTDKCNIEIRYRSKADVEMIWSCYRWFDWVYRMYKQRHFSVWVGLPCEVEFIISTGLREELPQRLYTVLKSRENDKAFVSRGYFDSLGGVSTVVNLLQLLCNEEWRCLPIQLKLVEGVCIQVLSTMIYNDTLMANINKLDVVGYVVRSFMRMRVGRGLAVRDNSRAPGRQEHNDFLALDLIKACLEFMAFVYDRPALHEDVCESPDMVEQLVSVALSPSFTAVEAQRAVCVLGAAIWFNVNRRWICNSSVLEALCDVTSVHGRPDSGEALDMLVLEFYIQLLLSSVVLSCSLQVSRRVYHKLAHTLEGFLARDLPPALSKQDHYTMSPLATNPIYTMLRLVFPELEDEHGMLLDNRYLPEDRRMLNHICELSIDSLLIALEVFIANEPYRAYINVRDDELTEYFVCCPYYLPKRLKEKGHKIVRSLYKKTKYALPMPTLQGLARSFLAKHYFGLDNILGRSADDIYAGVCPNRRSTEKPRLKPKEPVPMYIVKLA